MCPLRQELDARAAEAVALALEMEAQLPLMDEHLGRESAHHVGLPCIGLNWRSYRGQGRRIDWCSQASPGRIR